MPASSLHISYLGPGLLGASVGLACREFLPQAQVSAWTRRPELIADILRCGAAHYATTDIAQAVKQADLVILATPVGTMPHLAEQIIPHLKKGAIVTDVGSVKRSVHEHTGKLFTEKNITFIGSHPMAGSEKQGLSAATAQLFQQAPLILTNEEKAPLAAQEFLTQFWTALGCRCYLMTAAQHDTRIAQISHLPHIIAALCTKSALTEENNLSLLGSLAGGGFKDTTRIASGNPHMWQEILRENCTAILPLLTTLKNNITELEDILTQDHASLLENWLLNAKTKRETALTKVIAPATTKGSYLSSPNW